MMSQKKYKHMRKVLSNIPRLDPILDEALEQLHGDVDRHHRWMIMACRVLNDKPNYPILELLPNNFIMSIITEVNSVYPPDNHP